MDFEADLDQLLSEANAGKPQSAIKLLQSLRAQRAIQSDVVLYHGSRLLKNHRRKLGDEVWSVMEQVFIAAVDLEHEEWAAYCIKTLNERFPGSLRAERLYEMYKESVEDWDDAKKHCEDTLRIKPEDTGSLKRMCAMYKARGRTGEAVDALNKYLEAWGTDSEAWHELAELYLAESNLTKAVYCFDEVLLNNPRSLYIVLTYAELQYSVGDLETSRRYFCFAAHLDQTNVRALWGLTMVLLAALSKKADAGNEKLIELTQLSIARIVDLYKAIPQKPKLKQVQVALAVLDDLIPTISPSGES